MSYRYGIITTDAKTDQAGVFLVKEELPAQETKPVKKKTETRKAGLFPIDQNGIIHDTNLTGGSQWKTR